MRNWDCGVLQGHLCCNYDITEGLQGRNESIERLFETVAALCEIQVEDEKMKQQKPIMQDTMVEQNNTVSTVALLSLFIGCVILLYLYPLPE